MDYRLTDYGVVPGLQELQTDNIQKVFNLCKENGGRVIVPCGRYRVGGLRMWSDTVLYLESGAELIGSDVCEDYAVYPVPDGVDLRTDMELIPQQYNNRPWSAYRRAVISVYGGRNITIIGEDGAVIDGDDCCDPKGEEGYRGPHGIFITNVENITLQGYRISDCGNFMHQIDNCSNIVMRNVICEGGSDGVHLHHCSHVLIEDCIFHTGDDNIAGINIEDLTVRRCDLNTSTDTFRIGGSHILVEDCKIWGPGIFPHRMTVVRNRGTELVRDKSNTLPQHMGRHNLECVYIHFASDVFPGGRAYHDIVFRNCKIDNADKFMSYQADAAGALMSGTHLGEMTLENISFTNLKGTSQVSASEIEPLTVTLRNVIATDTRGKKTDIFNENSANTRVYQYVTLRERPELKDRAAVWFHGKWKVPVQAYLECMDAYLSGKTEYGWYLCLDGDKIAGGMGVIENDFHNRKDLTPNVCAVYTEENYRCRGIAGRLLNMVVDDMRSKGISPIYLLTDHTGFYERYGWKYCCMVQGDGEPEMSRMYVHN